MIPRKDDPILNIQWIHASLLEANAWNPNVVFGPELKLLERSILSLGWIQPILINPDKIIIDGFHRWKLSKDSKNIFTKYDGACPCAIINVDRPTAMIMTIRINRAKGTHVAVRMSEIVRSLIDEHGMLPEEIAQELGATMDEINLLHQDGVFKMKNIKDYKYSSAWYPSDTRLEKA